MTHIFKTTVGLCLLSVAHLAAAQAQWTGAGANNLWSTTGNWVGGEGPIGSQSISFPAAALGNTAQFNLPLTTLQLIDIQKCGFSIATDPLANQTVTLTGTQVITSVCNSAVQNEQSVLRMNLQLGNGKTINSLSNDAGIARTRRLIVEAPGGNGISFGTNLTLNADSAAGAAGARVFLETRIASGINIVKTGNGQVDFLQANTYSGFTTVQAGILNVADANGLGDTAPASPTLVAAGATLQISGLSPILERVSLVDNSNAVGIDPNFAAIGAGAIANAVDISGSAAQPTGVFIADGTELLLQGGITATRPIDTSVLYASRPLGGTIALGGPTTHSGLTKIGANTLLRLDGAVINDDRLSNNSIIDIDSSGTLNLNQNAASTETIAGLQGAGNVVLGNMDLTLNSEIDTTFSGNLSGGRVIKTGFNLVTASGDFSPNELRINQGDFILQTDSTAAVTVVGGKLETSVSQIIRGLTMIPNVPIGELEINGASIGTLTVLPTVATPNGIAISGSTLNITLGASGSDQIVLSNANNIGGISLSGGTLMFSGNTPSLVPTVILDNQRPGANLITGTFSAPFNNPNGTFILDGNTYSYTYTGGDGNDFAITRQALGTDYTWTGLGSSPNWNDAMNWSPSVVPPPASALIFPAGVMNKIATNNLPFATAMQSILVQDTGYLINGVSLQLTNGVPIRYEPPAPAGPPTIVSIPITFSALNPRIVVTPQGSAIQPQFLDMTAPSGGVSYSGNLRVEVTCASCSADALVGLRSNGGAGSSLTIFAPNGEVDSVAAAHDGITLIEAGTLIATSASGLGTVTGSASNGTEIWRGALLVIPPAIVNEHLSFKNLGTGNPPMLEPLTSGQSFAGPISVENDFRVVGTQPTFFQLGSAMIGGGKLQVVAPSEPLTRALPGSAAQRGLAVGVTLSGNLTSSFLNLEASANTVLRLATANNLPPTTIINLLPFSFMELQASQTIAGLTGSGNASFGNATLTLRHDDTKTFAGRLDGVNGLIAFGSNAGTGVFKVDSVVTPNRASYRVDSGTLDLEGNSSTGAVRIGNGILAGNGATLGVVENLPGATGKIAPLLADLGTGSLNIGASLTYEAIVNGAALGAHSELQVTGSVTINSSNASLAVLSNGMVPIGATITIISNDGVDLVNGTFSGLINGATLVSNSSEAFQINYQGGDGNDVTLTKQAAGLVTVDIVDIDVAEGLSGTTNVDVVFTRDTAGSPLTLNYVLTAGTASSTDFVASSGTVTFAAASLNAFVSVQVAGDNVVEAAETFSVVVVAPIPGGLNPIAPGIVTVLNDDSSTIELTPTSVVEGDGAGTTPATFTVGLSRPIQGVVTFNATSLGGTATSGTDYTPISQIVTVASGTSINQNLSVVRDAVVEGPETVTFSLSALTLPPGILSADVTIVNNASGLTITNDDTAQISVLPFSQNEGNVGNTGFTVGLNLSAPVQGAVTVRLTPTQLAGDNATPITDYNNAPVVVTFPASATASLVTTTLQVTGDTNVEPDETFSTVLDQITPVAGVSVASFTIGAVTKVTIVNDDLASATTTTLTISPTPSAAGQPYTATALVRNLSATFPTGTVVISTVPASSETCITPALVQFAANDTSTASCQITSALPGVRTFVATYVPTGAFTASSSTNVSHVVQGEVGDLQISSSLPAGVVTGQPYTITVQLVPTIPSSPLPTGNISIQHFPSSQLDSGTLIAGSVSIPTLSSTAVIKTLFVRYTDPTGVYPNRSSAFAQIVNKADVALTGLNSTPQPSSVNQAVTASFALSVVAPGAGTPTGTVTVTDGVDQCVATLPATSCIITLSTAGNRTLTYRYDGSTDYNAALANRPHSVGNSGSGSDIEITVSNGLTVMPQDRIVQYQVVSRVLAGDSASNVRIQAPVPAGIVSQIWSCVSESGASCPPNSTNIDGAIDALVTLPQSGRAVFVVSALTQAAEGRVQFAASASVAAPIIDPNLQNNSATDNDAVSNTATESGFEDE